MRLPRRLPRGALLALALGACGGAAASTGPERPPAAAPDRRVTAPVEAFLEVASGERELETLVSLQAGLVLVELTEGGDGGRVATAARVCGDLLRARLPGLEEHLVMMAAEGIAPTCTADVCTDSPGVEYDPARHFRFEEGPLGLRVAAIYMLDEANVGEDHVAEQRRRARAADVALAAAPCGSSLEL